MFCKMKMYFKWLLNRSIIIIMTKSIIIIYLYGDFLLWILAQALFVNILKNQILINGENECQSLYLF